MRSFIISSSAGGSSCRGKQRISTDSGSHICCLACKASQRFIGHRTFLYSESPAQQTETFCCLTRHQFQLWRDHEHGEHTTLSVQLNHQLCPSNNAEMDYSRPGTYRTTVEITNRMQVADKTYKSCASRPIKLR